MNVKKQNLCMHASKRAAAAAEEEKKSIQSHLMPLNKIIFLC
jgi:hypothetical protein